MEKLPRMKLVFNGRSPSLSSFFVFPHILALLPFFFFFAIFFGFIAIF